ncbi:hypothetical protein ONZ45_g17403 [Pleurotus djamor]|nr:hypothetical protein ONZ45_g17403 [Pleurotus djamor]
MAPPSTAPPTTSKINLSLDCTTMPSMLSLLCCLRDCPSFQCLASLPEHTRNGAVRHTEHRIPCACQCSRPPSSERDDAVSTCISLGNRREVFVVALVFSGTLQRTGAGHVSRNVKLGSMYHHQHCLTRLAALLHIPSQPRHQPPTSTSLFFDLIDVTGDDLSKNHTPAISLSPPG